MNVSQPTEDLRDVYLNECKVYDQYGAFIDNLEYRTTIEILSLMPCRNTLNLMEGECDFLDYLPILAMVEDEINAKPNILPGYKLKLANVNSGCSGSVSRMNFYKDISETLAGRGSVKHMILGPACTVATEPVAGLGKYLYMNQVSYTASGPQFATEREEYSRFFTMQPSITLYNDAYIFLFKRFGWHRIAVIHEVDPLFTAGAKDLDEKSKSGDFRIDYFGNFDDNPVPVLDEIKRQDLRIIVALFNPRNTELARKIWCEARKRDLTNKHHAWITPVWAMLDFKKLKDFYCKDEEIMEAQKWTFGTLGSDLRLDNDSMLVSGKTVQGYLENLECYKNLYEDWYLREYVDYYESLYNRTLPSTSVTLKEGYVYDSAWAIALALNETISELASRGLSIEDFTYENVNMSDMILNHFHSVNFSGISGQVLFDGPSGMNTSGNRGEHTIEIHQYDENGKVEKVALYSTNTDSLEFVHPGREDFLWKGGPKPPPDGASTEDIPYAVWAVTITCLTSGAGAILSIVCLTFTIYYRKHRVFKRATPRLNVLICTGTFIGFSSSFLYALVLNFYQDFRVYKPEQGVPIGLEFICNLVNWMTYIGFTLAFGSLVMKTWRLYRIFYNPAIRKRKYLDDKYLILGVLGMLLVVLIILSVWTGVARTSWCESQQLSPDNLQEYKFYHCCTNRDLGYLWYVFLGLWSAAAIIILLFGMFMAYQIKRNLGTMLHKYTETPLINVSSLLALLFSSVFLILHWVLPIDTEVSLSFLILLVALRDGFWMYPMILIMYIPMAYELIQDKRGKRRRFSSAGSLVSHVDIYGRRERRESSYSNSSFSKEDRRESQVSQASISMGNFIKPPLILPPVEEEENTSGIVSPMQNSNGSSPTVQINQNANHSLEDDVFPPTPSSRHSNVSPIPPDLYNDNRRPSILKTGNLLTVDLKESNRRVKFTEK
jgi:gamma-aminobutyric acid type B receptor